MTPRLTSRMTIDALFRRVRAAVRVLDGAGERRRDGRAILLVCAERGETKALLERTVDLDGRYRWTACGPQDVELESELATPISGAGGIRTRTYG